MSLVESSMDEASGIVHITINRPEVLNAIDLPTAHAMNRAVVALRGDSRVRCVVLRGAGRHLLPAGTSPALQKTSTRQPTSLTSCSMPCIRSPRPCARSTPR